MPDKEWLNIDEVATIFDINKKTARRLIETGRLKAKDFAEGGSKRRYFKIHRQWLEEFKNEDGVLSE